MTRLVALVAAGALAVTAATAAAAQPEGLYFYKSNQTCTTYSVTDLGWGAERNPSDANTFWRVFRCGAPTLVESGRRSL